MFKTYNFLFWNMHASFSYLVGRYDVRSIKKPHSQQYVMCYTLHSTGVPVCDIWFVVMVDLDLFHDVAHLKIRSVWLKYIYNYILSFIVQTSELNWFLQLELYFSSKISNSIKVIFYLLCSWHENQLLNEEVMAQR